MPWQGVKEGSQGHGATVCTGRGAATPVISSDPLASGEYHSCFQTQKLELLTEAKDVHNGAALLIQARLFLCGSPCWERGSVLDSHVRTRNWEGQGFLVPERPPCP